MCILSDNRASLQCISCLSQIFFGGFLLAGIAVVCSPDVLDVHTVSLATVMTSNIGYLFLLAGLTGEAYFDRYGEHNTSLYLSSGVGT